MRNGKQTVDVALHEVTDRSRRAAAFHRLVARSTNEEDAADYAARREAARRAPDDRDYQTVARVLPDVGQHRITSAD